MIKIRYTLVAAAKHFKIPQGAVKYVSLSSPVMSLWVDSRTGESLPARETKKPLTQAQVILAKHMKS